MNKLIFLGRIIILMLFVFSSMVISRELDNYLPYSVNFLLIDKDGKAIDIESIDLPKEDGPKLKSIMFYCDTFDANVKIPISKELVNKIEKTAYTFKDVDYCDKLFFTLVKYELEMDSKKRKEILKNFENLFKAYLRDKRSPTRINIWAYQNLWVQQSSLLIENKFPPSIFLRNTLNLAILSAKENPEYSIEMFDSLSDRLKNEPHMSMVSRLCCDLLKCHVSEEKG